MNNNSPEISEAKDIKKLKNKMGLHKETEIKYRCYKCDTIVNSDFEKCPECGEELDF